MKKLLLSTIAFLLAFGFAAQAQQRGCAADEVFQQQLQLSPKFAANQAAIERHTQRFLADGGVYRQSGDTIIILCVIHVVYSNPQENISYAQIMSQLEVLNQDFAGTNADISGVPSEFVPVKSGDTFIRYELDHIYRYSSTTTEWGTNDAVKSAYPPVSPENRLNMWVANIGGGILGYAQFPGGPLATDGLVMSPQYFGSSDYETTPGEFYLDAPYDKGRTTTHEIGHWLNLRHIWGDGNCSKDDFVSDTPIAGNPNYGCPAYPTKSCNSNGGWTSDQFMNYMDYVDDNCMFMFSAGQKARMRATFQSGGGRDGFVTNNDVGAGIDHGSSEPETPACSDSVIVSVRTDNYAEETSWQLTDAQGTVIGSDAYTQTADDAQLFQYAFGGLAPGTYTFTIFDSFGDGICCSYGNGYFSVDCADGTELGSGTSFTSSASITFEVPEPVTEPDPMPAGYCASAGTLVGEEWIKRVQVLENLTTPLLDNFSGRDAGYGDFTDSVAAPALTAGGSYTVAIFPGRKTTGLTRLEGYKVWIDWNRDGDFRDTDELVYSRNLTDAPSVRGAFTIPATASVGYTRMRVQMKYAQVPFGSCETFTRGEVEDYKLNVVAPARTASRTAAIAPASSSLSVFPNPASSEVNVSLALAQATQVSVSLYNAQGQLLAVKDLGQVSAVQAQLPVAGLNAGLYMVVVQGADGTHAVTKLLVE